MSKEELQKMADDLVIRYKLGQHQHFRADLTILISYAYDEGMKDSSLVETLTVQPVKKSKKKAE